MPDVLWLRESVRTPRAKHNDLIASVKRKRRSFFRRAVPALCRILGASVPQLRTAAAQHNALEVHL